MTFELNIVFWDVRDLATMGLCLSDGMVLSYRIFSTSLPVHLLLLLTPKLVNLWHIPGILGKQDSHFLSLFDRHLSNRASSSTGLRASKLMMRYEKIAFLVKFEVCRSCQIPWIIQRA